jgi:hypothetical protein
VRLAERAGDASVPTAERQALAQHIASTTHDLLLLLERLGQGGDVRDRDGTAQR